MFRKIAPAMGVVSFVVTAITLVPLSQAEAAECSDAGYTEAGTCAPVVPDPPMTTFQRQQQAEKDAMLAAMSAAPAGPEPSGSSARTMSTNPGDGASTPTNYQIAAVHDLTIYKEGEGNGKKWYTCGPSATRNMVSAMYKSRNGAYRDFGEHQFEIWERTTTSGTARANVAATLNANFSSYGHWTSWRPANASAYYNAVKLDTYSYQQSVIANVNTRPLKFFGGHDLDHFDIVYGYYLDGTTHYVRIGEEWDPTYTYGPSDYHPYGHKTASLADAFDAIDNKAIHGIVS